jgi:predicted membrane-bound spermidine synthase
MIISIWIFLSIITAILLIAFWRTRNAVWGGLTLGIVVGFIVTVVFAFKGQGFNWSLIGKFTVIGTLVGFLAELLGKFSDYLKKKS